jgi:hypothetical protein
MDASPPPSHFESLPPEVLQGICHYLSPRSLCSLSLVNRLFCRVTAAYRFSHIRFDIAFKECLEEDIEELTAILGRGDEDRFRHVRRVSITGVMLEAMESDEDYSEIIPKLWAKDPDDETDDLTEALERFCSGQKLDGYREVQNDAWMPLAEFLSRLPGLTDLVYTCVNEIPGCILQAMHQHHPHCRLHVSAFDLRAGLKLDPESGPASIAEDDVNLLTSPCLYAINLGVQFAGYTEDAVLELLKAGRGSQLKHIHIHNDSLDDQHNNPWPAFFKTQGQATSGPSQQQPTSSSVPATPRKVQLKTLTIDPMFYPPRRLKTWMAHVDFSALRRFEYHGSVDEVLMNTLIAFALNVPTDVVPTLSASNINDLATREVSNGGFRALRSFGLTLHPQADPNHLHERFDKLLATLLTVLPPLHHLSLEGVFGPCAWETTLSRHGPTLRKLHLPTGSMRHWVDADKILAIARDCPHLEDARLSIQRFRGRPKEVATYRAIAHIRKLRRLKIVFNCLAEYKEHLIRPLRPYSRGPNGSELNSAAVKTICRTLKNFAVDADLAKAIWDVITTEWAKVFKDQGNSSLKRLLVYPHVPWSGWPGWGGYGELGNWAEWVGRRWVCTRFNDEWLDYDYLKTVRAECVLSKLQKAMADGVLVEEWHDPDMEWDPEDLEQIFDINGKSVWSKVWPSKGGDWRDEWHSFPLDTTIQSV